MKKYFSTLLLGILVGSLFFGFVFAQQIPENMQEVQKAGEKALESSPGVIKGLWHDFVWYVNIFFEKIKNFWNNYIWSKVKSFLNTEVEKRKPVIQQELEKEKQELKTEIPQASKSIWQRLKNIIQWWKE